MKPNLILLIGILVALSIALNAYEWYKCVHAGPRFTAYDGQQLCERLAEHERFHGLPVRPCPYGEQ